MLFQAISEGNLEKVKDFIEANPSSLTYLDSQGRSPLLISLYYRQNAITDYITSKNPPLSVHEAAALGNIPVLKNFYQKDKNRINAYSSDGFTPLGLACFFSRKSTVKWLLENGANPNIGSRNEMKVNPIHSAVAARSIGITKLLIEFGANVNVKQNGGWTPLHQAASHGQIEIIELLITSGADINLTSDDKRRAIDMAKEGGYKQVVKMLQSP